MQPEGSLKASWICSLFCHSHFQVLHLTLEAPNSYTCLFFYIHDLDLYFFPLSFGSLSMLGILLTPEHIWDKLPPVAFLHLFFYPSRSALPKRSTAPKSSPAYKLLLKWNLVLMPSWNYPGLKYQPLLLTAPKSSPAFLCGSTLNSLLFDPNVCVCLHH